MCEEAMMARLLMRRNCGDGGVKFVVETAWRSWEMLGFGVKVCLIPPRHEKISDWLNKMRRDARYQDHARARGLEVYLPFGVAVFSVKCLMSNVRVSALTIPLPRTSGIAELKLAPV